MSAERTPTPASEGAPTETSAEAKQRDKTYCPHYGLPRVDGAGCPDCNFEEGVEAAIACLGDDAAQIRQELRDCRPNGEGFIAEEWADNMEKAAELLTHFLQCRRLSYPVEDL